MNSRDELRFSLPAEQYLERNHVMVYLEDALTQLLEHKDDNTAKVNPFKFFSSYFASVKDGTHVLLREFSYVKATLHNRSSFVKLFWRSFSNIARKTELMNMHDYHSLLCILCPDFPISLVQKTARIVLVDDSIDCLISFTDFVYAFQLQLCYDEFLSKCAEVYQVMLQNRSSGMDTVVVPTSQQRLHASASAAHGENATVTSGSGSDGVESSLFQRTLIVLGDKMDIAIPAEVIKDILATTSRITFYSFLTTLSKSAAVNQHIGKLPSRSELLTTFEPEMTSAMPFLPQLPPTDSSSAPSTGGTTRSNSVLPSESVKVKSSLRPSTGNRQRTRRISPSFISFNPRPKRKTSESVSDDDDHDEFIDNDDDDDDDDDI